MRNRSRQLVPVLTLSVAMVLSAPPSAHARKPGGGGETSKPYRLVVLPRCGSGFGLSMNQWNPATETVEVVGIGDDGVAHYWLLQDAANSVIMDFPLALPVDALAGTPADISDTGLIVGVTQLDDATVRAVLWPDAAGNPILLPVPDGFDGLARARAVSGGGIIIGDLHHTAGNLELAAWQILQDATGLHASPPTLFPWQGWGDFDVNDAGWVAATSTVSGQQEAIRFQLVWNGTEFTLAAAEGIFAGGVSNTVAINQAGDAAGERVYADGTSSVFAISLDGTPLDLPTSVQRRDVFDVRDVSAVNDATSAHGVQVLAQVRTIDRRGYIDAPRWSIFEEHGTITFLQDVVGLPADWPYDGTWFSNMSALNNAGWICGEATGFSQSSGDTVDVPVVLIRNP